MEESHLSLLPLSVHHPQERIQLTSVCQCQGDSISTAVPHPRVDQILSGQTLPPSVHMEESSVMQGAQGVLVQNWPTVSSAAARFTPTHEAERVTFGNDRVTFPNVCRRLRRGRVEPRFSCPRALGVALAVVCVVTLLWTGALQPERELEQDAERIGGHGTKIPFRGHSALLPRLRRPWTVRRVYGRVQWFQTGVREGFAVMFADRILLPRRWSDRGPARLGVCECPPSPIDLLSGRKSYSRRLREYRQAPGPGTTQPGGAGPAPGAGGSGCGHLRTRAGPEHLPPLSGARGPVATRALIGSPWARRGRYSVSPPPLLSVLPVSSPVRTSCPVVSSACSSVQRERSPFGSETGTSFQRFLEL
ncbi:hypothetical protein COCON_G00054590 [Conger conger]|uniref:Cadherin C-terminal catenin-binding domain-containing protein n=1 Tax=Conger conger TaxID=82655 RepID=A0A9Q1DW41_CONCO|nr:hypothetical protein COCON_G00054590 [Conger conger]